MFTRILLCWFVSLVSGFGAVITSKPQKSCVPFITGTFTILGVNLMLSLFCPPWVMPAVNVLFLGLKNSIQLIEDKKKSIGNTSPEKKE